MASYNLNFIIMHVIDTSLGVTSHIRQLVSWMNKFYFFRFSTGRKIDFTNFGAQRLPADTDFSEPCPAKE